MAKTLQEAAVTTASARAKLTAGTHWRAIDPDVHLGYRKGARGGKWVVRWRDGKGYRQEAVGVTDDAMKADNLHSLDFNQAVRRSKVIVEDRRATAKASADGRTETVRSAIEDYIAVRAARAQTRPNARGKDAALRLGKHALSDKLADQPLHEISETDLSEWRARLPKTLATTTVRRHVNDLKAALNLAARMHRRKLPAHLPIVIKNGLAVDEATAPIPRDMQILADDEVRAVIKAAWRVDEVGGWDGDFGRLVVLLAATGARFSQLAVMRISDVQAAQSRVMVPASHKGRAAKARDRYAVRVGADVIASLKPAIAGRKSADTLLERWRHVQTGPAVWERESRGAWKASSEMARPWRLAANEAGLSADTSPYSLRHSSIVRGLRANLPVRLVAALHDTSSAMIEKHYSAFIVDALDSLTAAAIIPLSED